MLAPLLTSEQCASCQGCCKFRENELHDTPAFTRDLAHKIMAMLPDAEFIIDENGIHRIQLSTIHYPYNNHEKKYVCPLLGNEGCILGSDRPLDCQLWPFYIMKNKDIYCITLARDCPSLSKINKDTLMHFLSSQGILTQCLDFIKIHPEMIEYMRDDVDFITNL